MIQLYIPLHIAAIIFKKQFLRISLLLFFIVSAGLKANAQCDVNPVANQVVCNNTATAAINFTGTATTFNWTNNMPSIGLATSGTGNIASFIALNPSAAAVIATITVTPSTGACTGTPINFTITVNPSPVVNVTPPVSCGGVTGLGCNGPLTASGNADVYVWSPLAGLYSNCTMTAPYTGGNATVVYAGPTTNTIYTVSGTRLATGCTNTGTAQVYYTPPPPVVTPASVNMCLGDAAVKLKAGVQPVTLQFCSGTVNIPVPDNNPAGVLNNIAVSGIPIACTVTAISVTINMPHTRIGNMVFVLRAPNGTVLNLDYHLGATGGSGSTSGFVNTIITSVGLTALNTGINPYSGTFKADAQVGPAGGFGATGPTGMQPNTSTWTSLYTGAINGNWTLGFYDGVTGDVGTLNSWCLNITYSCGSVIPTTPAVWTPAAGLFIDPTATTPYTAGTQRDSVWVRPTPAGVYTYQVTAQAVPPSNCTSPARTVVVTVGMPISITVQPVNKTICTDGTATFTVTATGGGTLNYQWQVSTNGGSTFTNLVNGGVYTGATTATLTVTSPPVNMSGYYYRVLINGAAVCASVTSAAAILTVNLLPNIMITANPLIIGPTQTTTIFSTVTPNPAATYTWYYNNSILPGAVSSSLLVSYGTPGDYQLRVTDVNGCTNLSNIITIANSFALNIYTYPNPSGGIFQVRYFSTPNNSLQRSLTVYNNMGDRIITRTFTQTIPYQKIDVDVRTHGKGLYWIELREANGKRLAMSRAVVQ